MSSDHCPTLPSVASSILRHFVHLVHLDRQQTINAISGGSWQAGSLCKRLVTEWTVSNGNDLVTYSCSRVRALLPPSERAGKLEATECSGLSKSQGRIREPPRLRSPDPTVLLTPQIPVATRNGVTEERQPGCKI